jgi:hypothetical protein
VLADPVSVAVVIRITVPPEETLMTSVPVADPW